LREYLNIMAVIIFRLNGVPDDEADEVRNLLADNNIEFYETSAGRWGISVAAIWLKDEGLKAKARSLIDEYQEEKAIRTRREYENLRREGRVETIIDRIKQRPVQFLFYLAIIIFILYVSIRPFISIGE
jgi:hypothetical protein